VLLRNTDWLQRDTLIAERLRQIEELYRAARENRAALDQADPELRREVELLLEQDGISLPAPPGLILTLPGLRSRWVMPFSWRTCCRCRARLGGDLPILKADHCGHLATIPCVNKSLQNVAPL
jgi:hypothetical protein